MANMEKLVCTWSGFSGAPAYTTFYWSAGNATTMQPAIKSFLTTCALYLATPVSISVPANGEVIDEITGKMVNVWSGGTVGTIAASGGTAFNVVTGALVRWDTNAFQNGRRVRGRTFLVPLSVSHYSTSGTISTTAAGAMGGAGNTLITNNPGVLQVWSRPIPVDNPHGYPKRDGKMYPASTATCPVKVTYLSSRRD